MNENSNDVYPLTRRELFAVGLRYNPFNPGGDSDLHKFFVDRDDAISRIVNQFEEIINENRMKTFFLMGEEGLGRTSILRVLEYEFGKGFKKELKLRMSEAHQSVETMKKKLEEINSIKECRDDLEKSLKDLKNYRDATNMLSREIPDSLKLKIESYFEAKMSKEEKHEEIEKSLEDIGNYIRISILKGLIERERIPYEEIEKLITSKISEDSWKKIKDFCQKKLNKVNEILIDVNNKSFNKLFNKMSKINLKTSNNHEKLIKIYDNQVLNQKKELNNAKAKYKYIEQEYRHRSERFESLIITDKNRLIKGKVLKNKTLFMRTLINLIADKVELTTTKDNEEFFLNMVENINQKCKNKNLIRSFQNELENKGYTAKDFIKFYAFNGTVKKLLDIFVETSKRCHPRLNEEEAVLLMFEFFIDALKDFFTAFIFLFDDASHFGGKRAREVRSILVHLFQKKSSIFVFAVNWTNKLPVTYGELFSRFGEPTDLTKFAFLTKTDCERSIKLRLKSARIEGWKAKNSFEPFSIAAIDEIVKESRKVPIFWVYMCYHALEILRSMPNGSTRITIKMAKKAIQNAWADIISRMSENQRIILYALVKFKNIGARKLARIIGRDLGNTSKELAKFRRMQLLSFKNIPRSKPKTKKEEQKRINQLSTFKAYSLAIPSLEKYLRDLMDEFPDEFPQ
ncbi:MAG: hypothetical protein PVF58_04000 [Candidatus Methanofastidiosia archaeon]|jgi:hypothetical protein